MNNSTYVAQGCIFWAMAKLRRKALLDNHSEINHLIWLFHTAHICSIAYNKQQQVNKMIANKIRSDVVVNIIKKSSSGIQSLPLDSILLSQRKVFLSGGITMESASKIIQQLLFLESEDQTAPIELYLSSPGGEVNAGLMLYDQLKGMNGIPIKTYCTGLAASMAAILLAGGQKGRRFILPHSKVMIHEPLISGGLGGSASSIQRTAESIMETKNITTKLLAQDTGRSIKQIEQAISYDNFMNAEQAVAFGICDAIVYRI